MVHVIFVHLVCFFAVFEGFRCDALALRSWVSRHTLSLLFDPAIYLKLILVLRFVGVLEWTVQHIKSLGGDPRRIYLVGHSAGGHLGISCLPPCIF
jgi:hypothetical protein